MATQLTNMSPQQAWSPWQPTAKQKWDRRAAAHLFRRAGFGASESDIAKALKDGPSKTIDRLMDPSEVSTSQQSQFERDMGLMKQTMMGGGEQGELLAAWWLYRMATTPHPLLEKATLFWHGHFATSNAKVRNAAAMMAQNEALRKHALGRFEPMVQDMSRDPAMLSWLDAAVNRKARPNENYARELMELFCLGEGHYTENDIKEVAKAFTGWGLRRDRFVFNKYQHDFGEKQFLGQKGNFNGDEAVRIVLDQPAAPRFIATKLVRYFVSEEPPLIDAMIEPIAQQLRQSDFDLSSVIKRIISSNIFFASAGCKVRSPVQLAIGLLRTLEAKTDFTRMTKALERLGQGVFYPPSVKGWDGGRQWIDSSTLLGRANLVHAFLTSDKTRYAHGSLAETVHAAGVSKDDEVADWLLDMMVAVPVPGRVRSSIVGLLGDSGDRNRQIGRAIHTISTLPEFQLI